jgi:hypothetical protein
VKLSLRRRFWPELLSAIACGVLFLLTLVWNNWIEIVSGSDPDRHNGSLEWGILAVTSTLALTLAITARYEWRRMLSIQIESQVRV